MEQYENVAKKYEMLEHPLEIEIPGGAPCATGLGTGSPELDCLNKATKAIAVWSQRHETWYFQPQCPECLKKIARAYGIPV